MIRRIAAFLCAVGLATQGAAAADSALATDFMRASDSTGFVTTGWNAAWLARYWNVDHYAAFSVGELDHRQRSLGVERRQRVVGVAFRAIDARDGTGTDLTIQNSFDSRRDRLLFDGSHVHLIGVATRVELFGNRAPVDTAVGLVADLHYTSGGLGIERRLSSRWSTLANASWAGYSDRGARHTLRAGLVYELAPQAGVTLQWRGKWSYTDRIGDVGGYFSPDTFSEQTLLIGWAKRSGPWRWRTRIGLGRQHVDVAPWKTVRIADLDLRYTVSSRQQISLQYSYTDAAERPGPDTNFRSIKLRWLLAP
ncbi:MAG: hypothetical protein EBZ40_08895 [Gammaproteobacteria bacterium]|jgi:hypothetical protein|nr:hypothetical protein [Gammaproteobacteria bacterium]